MTVLEALGMLIDLATAIVAFGLIIVVHEAGHFLAARWAGVRVLAFAVGFGPALFSWRRGLGFRRGSSEGEYERLVREAGGAGPRGVVGGVSPTEYRFNALPFGGYVKMLGQDDTDPTRVSDAADSWQNCRAWRRLVVISAGVVANVVCAAVLYVIVFQVGLRTEPAVVGATVPGSPAARAVAVNGPAVGVEDAGLAPGDVIVRAGGRRVRSFQDVVLASAMARKGRVLEMVVEREGVPEPLVYEVMPEQNPVTGLLEIGLEPARSPVVLSGRTRSERRAIAEALSAAGLEGVRPGMRLVRVADVEPVRSAQDLIRAGRASGGEPIEAEFADGSGERVRVVLEPVPAMEMHVVPGDPKRPLVLEHVLGMAPVMRVVQVDDGGIRAGLEVGDVFARIGGVEFPNLAQGIAEIRGHAPGSVIDLVVLRGEGPVTERRAVGLKGTVSSRRTIGFRATDVGAEAALLSLPPERLLPARAGEEAVVPAATRFIREPGTLVVSVDGRRVSDMAELQRALREATAGALAQGAGASVGLIVRVPAAEGGWGPEREIRAELTAQEVAHLHGLGWRVAVPLDLFEPERFVLRASNPIGAVSMGLDETQRVMMMTYLTFARLWEGTVRVEHLKGPVGIAHIGTRVASRGVLWLMFFAALISVNLAVINFLPLPIVDGGQAVFIVAEMIRGKPVPMAVQSATTMVGLVLVAVVFLVITFNDVMQLLG